VIEYYLKYNLKNRESNIIKLMLEMEKILNIEDIEVEKTDEIFYEELNEIISKKKHTHLCDLIYTVNKHKKEKSFLKKYIKPQKKEKIKYTFADLFAGCGGLSLGIEKSGFNCIFVNEIDETFAETHYFNNNIPLSNYFVGDINELVNNFSSLKMSLNNVDLVCGGPPCQGFSMANRQRIIDDPRNNLYKAYLKFLQKVHPKFFIMENVKGMTNKIDEILLDFNAFLGNDYSIHYSVLNAKDFGLPQNRERFFIIGNRIGVDSEGIFNDIRAEKINELFVLKDALNSLPTLKPKNLKNNNSLENRDVGYYITKHRYDESNYLKFINERNTEYLFNHKNRFNNQRDIDIFTRLPQGQNSLHHSITDIMPYSSRNHMFKDKYFKLDNEKVCKTITSHMKFDCNMYIHPTQARGLSPREAARVQSFPDDFLFRGSQNKWYAQIGNAVPVKLAEIIGNHIIKHLC
jgi:DNA (cytosine-5)-methyltransferase 1